VQTVAEKATPTVAATLADDFGKKGACGGWTARPDGYQLSLWSDKSAASTASG